MKGEMGHMAQCKSCGGMVGEDGLAMPLGESEEFMPHEGAETEQQASTERMRDESGFADAVKRKGYAEGGEVYEPPKELTDFKYDKTLDISSPADATMKAKETSDEMKRRKMERYGFKSKS